MKRAVSTLLLAALLTTPARADQTPLVGEPVAGRIICDRPHATTKRLAIVGAAIVGIGVVVWLVAKHRKHAAPKGGQNEFPATIQNQTRRLGYGSQPTAHL